MSETQQITKQELLERAAEYEREEVALVAQVASLPARVGEAIAEAKSAYNVAHHYWQKGERDKPPVLEELMGAADALQQSEASLKAEAREKGMKKLEYRELYYRLVAQEEQAKSDALQQPLQDLREQMEKIKRDLSLVENARSGCERRKQDAEIEAMQYEQALRFHRAESEPRVRM